MAATELVGAWQLVRGQYRYEPVDGSEATLPLGEGATGLLLYSADMHMSVTCQAEAAATTTHCGQHNGDLWATSAEERAAAASCYMSYAGKYEVVCEGDKLVGVRHLVEVSLFPAWVGTSQERLLEFTTEGGRKRLTLKTKPALRRGVMAVGTLVWEKLDGAPSRTTCCSDKAEIPRNLTTYLFDLDGTLVNTHPLIVRGFNRVAEEAGGWTLPLAESVFEMLQGKPLVQCLAYLWHLDHKDTANDGRLKEICDQYRSVQLPMIDEIPPSELLYPGFTECLRELHARGKKLAVVSARNLASVHYLLRHVGYAQFFQVVIGVDTLPVTKPDPAPLFYALGQLHSTPGESVMVGDSDADLVAGQRAGAVAVLVPWSGQLGVMRDLVHAPFCVMRSPSDLL
eukprot:TRINITY_DN79_c1_g1_i1.p1 TRINITY_DN79_c1_g1~~TRINITY_DN79_c1_g1_i1.p1  ORF type:complete len:398 (+),score=87.75 TRINITY_DN79_c1_g1_i1:72-1265(+)